MTEKSLVVVCSFHHGNTEKVARVMAGVLRAEVRKPEDINPEELREYALVGFGSGIDSDSHYEALLHFADGLPAMSRGNAFIFSTCGMPVSIAGEGGIERYSVKSHKALRKKLIGKGFAIVGEYSCPGFNTNSFLRLLGGVNKGRPNAEDLGRAGEFARRLGVR